MIAKQGWRGEAEAGVGLGRFRPAHTETHTQASRRVRACVFIGEQGTLLVAPSPPLHRLGEVVGVHPGAPLAERPVIRPAGIGPPLARMIRRRGTKQVILADILHRSFGLKSVQSGMFTAIFPRSRGNFSSREDNPSERLGNTVSAAQHTCGK